MEYKNIEQIYQLMQMFQKMHMGPHQHGETPRSELMLMKRIALINDKDVGVIISQLAEMLDISNPAVSQKINALEEKGYVERYSQKTDRRRVYVRLTPLGLEILEKESERLIEGLTNVFSKLGEAETEQFTATLHKIYNIVQEHKCAQKACAEEVTPEAGSKS